MLLVFDEDIPRAFKEVFEKHGFEVIDIRDVGLRGASDEAVFRFALKHRAVLVTGDLGFANPLRFDLRKIRGVILNRLSQTISLTERLRILDRLLSYTPSDSFPGFLSVFEVGRVRRRSIH